MKPRPNPLPGDPELNRREFLRLLGLNFAAVSLPWGLPRSLFTTISAQQQAELRFPRPVQQVLDQLPELSFDDAGRLIVQRNDADAAAGYVPLVPTRWNQDHRRSIDLLEPGTRWAIVLHWFGDTGEEDQDIDAYMRGFNALRPVFNYETRTSAHFLVGNTHPAQVFLGSPEIGIVQTQIPDEAGQPYLASHLQALDYTAHWDKRQYFVRAFYQLGHTEPGASSVLQEFFDSPVVIDPNLRSIAVEITGYSFDDPGRLPGPQKIANIVALVWALMKRYRVQATDILGHHEIQLGKSDPGKIFITLIRYYLGIMALIDPDPAAADLVFGGFRTAGADLLEAAQNYFRFVRSYLVLTGTPEEVYRWESDSGFWFTMDLLVQDPAAQLRSALRISAPLAAPVLRSHQHYLVPDNHEGVDLVAEMDTLPISLIAPGVCLFSGDTDDPHWQQMALFRHRQPNGAEVVAVYGHLAGLEELQPGHLYPQQFTIGRIQRPNSYQDPYLHFAIAYGATWDTDLSRTPTPPLNAGVSWIRQRYLDPMAFLKTRTQQRSHSIKRHLYD